MSDIARRLAEQRIEEELKQEQASRRTNMTAYKDKPFAYGRTTPLLDVDPSEVMRAEAPIRSMTSVDRGWMTPTVQQDFAHVLQNDTAMTQPRQLYNTRVTELDPDFQYYDIDQLMLDNPSALIEELPEGGFDFSALSELDVPDMTPGAVEATIARRLGPSPEVRNQAPYSPGSVEYNQTRLGIDMFAPELPAEFPDDPRQQRRLYNSARDNFQNIVEQQLQQEEERMRRQR